MTVSFAPLDISVVTYNSSRWLDAFMRSLLAQDYPCDRIRLLVRDNGSTDATVQMFRELAAEHAARFAAIEIDAGDNVGFGRGHNANLARAQAQWLLVTNVDLEFEPVTLTELLGRAAADPADVACWECRQKPYEHPKHYNPVNGDAVWCSSACTLFRVEAMRAIGGYEPKLFLYGEDVEISYRLRDRGWQLRYVPRATVWHFTYEHAAEVKPAQFLGSTLANVLLRNLGGPHGWTAYCRRHGDAVTRLDRTEPSLNDVRGDDPRDTTTPRAMATLVGTLLGPSGLPPDARATLRQWMMETETGAKRLRAGLPAHWPAGDKTGTGGAAGQAPKVNDVAWIEPPGRAPLVVAAYFDVGVVLDGPRDEDQAVLADVGRLVAAHVDPTVTR